MESRLLSPAAGRQLSLSAGRQILQDWLALSFIPGAGCTLFNRLVREFGSPGNVLGAPLADLLSIEGIRRKTARALTDPEQLRTAREQATRELEQLAGLECMVTCSADHEYPAGLRDIADPPALLYSRGERACLQKQAVAIVGSRAATTYGKQVSYELARELARNGICVVSGMAMGIDGEAHAGALAAGGKTIGVLGCGVDVIYPRQHKKLFGDVAASGLLLSEYPLGTPPDGFRFPERNRIISGITLGTVVVEASLKSGSLITARLALDQGREVFAVPGRIDSTKSQGTHRLLQLGAKLVTCVDDILEELEVAGVLGHAQSAPAAQSHPAELPDEENHLLSCLDVYPVTIDELVLASGYAAASVFQLLLQLELKGLVMQLPGQLYERRMQGVPPQHVTS